MNILRPKFRRSYVVNHLEGYLEQLREDQILELHIHLYRNNDGTFTYDNSSVIPFREDSNG